MATRDELVYTGKILEWAGHGSYAATSGVGQFQNPESETREGEGPIPEGTFEVPLTISKTGATSEILDVHGRPKLKLDQRSEIQTVPKTFDWIRPGLATAPVPTEIWGCHRVRLKKIKLKNPAAAKRDGFYIHDSIKGYSAGCIEVAEEFFTALIEFAEQQSKRGDSRVNALTLTVDYSELKKLNQGDSGRSTNGRTYFRREPGPDFQPIHAAPKP